MRNAAVASRSRWLARSLGGRQAPGSYRLLAEMGMGVEETGVPGFCLSQ